MTNLPLEKIEIRVEEKSTGLRSKANISLVPFLGRLLHMLLANTNSFCQTNGG